MTRTTRLGLLVAEHTRSTLCQTITNRLPRDVLLWGDEGVAARDLFCLSCYIFVTTAICSDVFYSVVDSRGGRSEGRGGTVGGKQGGGRPRRNAVSVSVVFSSRRRHTGVELHRAAP